MKILITGGSGFIGSNLSLKLIEKGHNITVLDNLSEQIHGNQPEKCSELFNSIKEKVTFIKGDVRNLQDWKNALQDQEIIVHLAAETGTGQSMYEIKKYADVNIIGTALLLDYLTNNKHHVKKVIIASSRAIYGEGKYQCKDHGVVFPTMRNEYDMKNGDFNCKCPFCKREVQLLPTTEDSLIHPNSIYGITKQTQEQMVLMVCKSLNISSIAFRYQNVFGPGQSLSNPYTGILSIFSSLIRNNKSINIFEDGKESRDFIFIDDVVEATILGIEDENMAYEVFNVGSGIPTDVLTIAGTLKTLLNTTTNINVSGNFRLGDIRHNYADLSNIKVKLGFEPKHFFENSIKQFVYWVNNQKINPSDFDKSIKELKDKGLFK